MKIMLKNVDEVAFLRLRGASLLAMHLESFKGGRPTIVFELEVNMPEDDLFILRRDFVNRKTTVEPRVFSEMVKETSSLLLDELRSLRSRK